MLSLTKKLLTITNLLKYTTNKYLTKKLKKKGVSQMKNDLFVTASEVAQDLGISKPFAYKLVRQMNAELEEQGFMTIAGRVSRRFYEEKFYGLQDAS